MARNEIFDAATLASIARQVEDDAAAAVAPAMALARCMLDAALSRRQRRILRRPGQVIILATFDEPSVEMIHDCLRAMAIGPRIVMMAERSRHGRYKSGGVEQLSVLEDGRSILFVTTDAAARLAPEVHAAADEHIILPPPDVRTVRRTIRAVTGAVARGLIAADLSGLSSLDIITAIRPTISSAQCVANLRRASQRRRGPEGAGSARPLGELALTRAVRSWSEDTLATMAEVTEGSAPVSILRYGVMQGPPGTGKTTIAAGLARSAGWQFHSDSVAGWFSSSDGHLGGVVKAASRFFDNLKAASGPIVGFLDELDALPNRASLDSRDSQWWSPVITHVLLQIDLLRQAGKPILLLAATNHFNKLDAALIRAGRLESHVPVYPPDEDERAELFHSLLKGDGRSEAEILARLSPWRHAGRNREPDRGGKKRGTCTRRPPGAGRSGRCRSAPFVRKP